MPQKYKKQAYAIGAIIGVSVVIMIAAVVAIIISATRALPANAIMDYVTVGDYVGKNRAEIDEPNLEMSYVDVYSEFEPGMVVAQSISKGTSVERGSTIILNVSKGSSAVQIPPVVNLPEDEAVKVLRDNGFNVVVQYQINTNRREIGVVSESYPEAGNTVAFGSAVTIKVYGNYTQITTTSTTTTQPVTHSTELNTTATTTAEQITTTTEAQTVETTKETTQTVPQPEPPETE